jgi:hypothetical protein
LIVMGAVVLLYRYYQKRSIKWKNTFG